MQSALNAQLGIATALLNSLWQCALLALVAALVLQMLNRRSAALRHAAGMGFLLAMAGLPAWTFLQYLLQPAGDINNRVLPASPEIGVAVGVFPQPSSGWAAAMCGLWLMGVAFMLVRHLGGLWWIDRLERREFQPLPPEWQKRLDALQRTMGITRKIVVRVAENVLVPFTARLFRPVIWMPLSLLSSMPREQIEALLAHELAHIHRLDWLCNGVQCVIEALLFFHPGVWWLSRRTREERELACDDVAVTVCADAVVLAEALAALARDRQSGPRLLLAANGNPLMNRIAHLLSGASTPARTWAPAGLVVLVAAGAFLVAPLGVGYAAPSHPTEPTGSVSNFSVLQAAGVSPVSAAGADEAAREAIQATRDAEQIARDAEDAARAREQVARDAEGASRGWEQAARDAEHAARDREQASRDSEQAARDRAAWLSEARPVAQAARAPRAERAAQAMDAVQAPQVVRPVAAVPGFTGRTGVQPVNAEAAASPTGQAAQALVRLVAADPRVAGRIGTPVAVTSDGFTGSWRRDEDAGIYTEVRLSFTLTGPQGRARIWAAATQEDSQWSLTALDVREFTPLH